MNAGECLCNMTVKGLIVISSCLLAHTHTHAHTHTNIHQSRGDTEDNSRFKLSVIR
jgi:hypothetical protein